MGRSENLRDAAAGERAAITERLCAATGVTEPIDQVIRFVRRPDHTVVPDLNCNPPGCGVWITRDREGLALAISSNSFEGSFNRAVCVRGDLVERTEERLDALAICRKVGKVVIGFGRVKAARARRALNAMPHAVDASANAARKLDGSFGPKRAGPVVVNAFTSAQLDLAFGRSNVVHAGLLARNFPHARCATGSFLDGSYGRSAVMAKYSLVASAKKTGH